jgi:hypothetical protein
LRDILARLCIDNAKAVDEVIAINPTNPTEATVDETEAFATSPAGRGLVNLWA